MVMAFCKCVWGSFWNFMYRESRSVLSINYSMGKTYDKEIPDNHLVTRNLHDYPKELHTFGNSMLVFADAKLCTQQWLFPTWWVEVPVIDPAPLQHHDWFVYQLRSKRMSVTVFPQPCFARGGWKRFSLVCTEFVNLGFWWSESSSAGPGAIA